MAWNAGNPSADAIPPANTINVTTGADGAPMTNNVVSSAASAVCTSVVVMSSTRLDIRSASAPPTGPSSAIGTKPAAATAPVHAAWPVTSVT